MEVSDCQTLSLQYDGVVDLVPGSEVRVEAGQDVGGRPVVRLDQQEADTDRHLEDRYLVEEEEDGTCRLVSTFTRPSIRSSRTTEALMEKRRRLRHIPRKEIRLMRMMAFTLVRQSSVNTFFFRLKLSS